MAGESPLPGRDVAFEGVLLRGRYRVDQKLGQGGMAAVYMAADTELGRTVVVKVPLPHVLRGEGFKERFEIEVKGLVDTEHPHVVSILARGEHEGIPYFVIQFLRGGSLEDRIRQRPEEPRDVLGWLPYVADALDFIHSKRIVHRDVKPGNILFDEAGNVFLSDFGVAKALGVDSALTSVGFTVGSPHYMAPEQATGGDVGPASDQYALGVTVYESLAQALPFDGTNPLEVLIKKGSQDPRPLRGIRDIPQAVSDVVLRALAREPARRWPSCTAFAEAFEAAVWTSDTHATPSRTPSSAARHTMGGSLDISGLTLLGHYKVGERLGSGGMGTVYEAEDTDLGKTVVIKVPHPRLLLERGFLDRFEREVAQLLRLEHPSIVRVLARGEVDGFPFYVLQHMKGGSLSDRLKKAADRRQSAEDVLAWFEATAKALDFLHSRRLIHRDVKPGNILFDEYDHAYLSDFGIAKAHEEQDARLTTTNTGVGSPRYMAPEQAGEKFDGRADQYALATTVYEALSGRVPFPEGSALEIMIKKMQETPPALDEFVPGLPRGVTAAIRRALSGDPEKRYPTCRAFFLAFKRALREEPLAIGEAAGAAAAPGGTGATTPPPIATPIPTATRTPAPSAAPRRPSGVSPTRRPPGPSPTGRTGATTGGVASRATPSGARTPSGVTPVASAPIPLAPPVPRKRLAAIRIGDVGFVVSFLAISALARLAPWLRFALPHGLGDDLGRDTTTLLFALGAPALVVAIGHGTLLHRRGVAPAWAFALATLSGAAVAIAALLAASGAIGAAVPLHPLGVIVTGFAGLCIGFCQWLVFERRLASPLRWWIAIVVGGLVAGAIIELSPRFAPAAGDALYAAVVASGLVVGLLGWLALRRMTAGTARQGERA